MTNGWSDPEKLAREIADLETAEIAEASKRKVVFLRGRRMSIFERITFNFFAHERKNSSNYHGLYSLSELQDEINRESTLKAIKITVSLKQLTDFLEQGAAILRTALSAPAMPQETRIAQLEAERSEIMKAMCITFDAEIAAEEGDAYEVPAEPEPLYFDTLPKAVANTMALFDREFQKLETEIKATHPAPAGEPQPKEKEK